MANAKPTIASTTKAAKANTVSRSPAPVIERVLLAAGKISKKIEAAGDENGSKRPAAPKRLVGARRCFDAVEVVARTARELLLVETPRIRRARRHERRAAAGQALEHRVDVFVLEDRRHDDPVASGQTRRLPVEGGGIVR